MPTLPPLFDLQTSTGCWSGCPTGRAASPGSAASSYVAEDGGLRLHLAGGRASESA